MPSGSASGNLRSSMGWDLYQPQINTITISASKSTTISTNRTGSHCQAAGHHKLGRLRVLIAAGLVEGHRRSARARDIHTTRPSRVQVLPDCLAAALSSHTDTGHRGGGPQLVRASVNKHCWGYTRPGNKDHLHSLTHPPSTLAGFGDPELRATQPMVQEPISPEPPDSSTQHLHKVVDCRSLPGTWRPAPPKT